VSLEIVVDSNEAAMEPKIIKALQNDGIPVKTQKLPAGDYFISPFIFERKTSSDFIRSIRDGALWRELDGIKRMEFLNPILLVEGSFVKALKFSKFSIKSIYGALWSVATSWKTQIIATSNQFHTAVLFSVVYKNLLISKEKKIYPIKYKPKSTTLDEKIRAVVEGYPDVGPILALNILNYFDNIKNFVNADKDELVRVKGIGVKLAGEIYEVNNTSFSSLTRQNNNIANNVDEG
jgi:ERCC4-type nuclease